ncbi:MAG: TasA family protein [Bacillota bacterium]
MKKKLWLAMGSGLFATLIGLGGTLALFSDAETSDATFVAGTLCIDAQRNDGEAIPGPMFYVTPEQGETPGGVPGQFPTGLWAPGDSHQRTLTVFNPTSCSTMDAWLDSVQASLQPGSDAMLADKLYVEVTTPQLGSDVQVAEGWLSDFLSGPVLLRYPDGSRIPLWLGSNRHIQFKVIFDITADNSYQDTTLVVDFTVNAEQKTNNP